jgi:ATP-dependent helicase Lhr and Lhr-like helicase
VTLIESAVSTDAFELLHLDVQQWVARREWMSLRPIQSEAIQRILQAPNDILIAAPTASGKTEAALLPIVSQVAERPEQGVRCLYIAPLKALINDLFPRAQDLVGACGLDVMPWHGEIPQSQKNKFVKAPSAVLLITPESLEAMMVQRGGRIRELFGMTSFVVVDEVHAFAGSERGAQVQSLLNRLERTCDRRMRANWA